MQLRRKLDSIGAARAPGLNLSLSGSRSIPVICVEFANREPSFEIGDYQALLFGSPNATAAGLQPTLTQYYADNSDGQFVPTGEVMGWFELPEDDDYYELSNNGLNQRLGELLKFAFDEADGDTDFGQFDNDGPDGIPNSGDDDGLVDTVFVVHSESGGECNGSSNVWSHSFQYSKYANHSGPYVTDDIRRNELGQPVLNDDGTAATIKIEDYTIQPGLSCPSPGQIDDAIVPIGVFCHEYGHALGLPDLYDRTPQGSPDSEGVGNYCLMAGGSYGADGEHAETPVNLSAWCKAVLGWGNLQEVSTNLALVFEPVQARNRIYSIDVAGTNGQEFFLFEFRDASWTDPFGEKLNWDRDFNPGGLAIWHVDERVGNSSPEWPFANRDQGQNDAPSLPGIPLPSFTDPHSLVSLIQADGNLHLERRKNRGDGLDLFVSGSDFDDDENCRAGSRTYSGQPSGISISNINLATRTADVRVDDFPEDAEPLAIASLQRADHAAPQALPATELNPEVVPHLRQLHQIEIKGARSGWQSLDEQDRAFIKTLPVEVIKQGVSVGYRTDILQISSEERTITSAEIDSVDPSLGVGLHGLIGQSNGSEPADIRISSDGHRIESIIGLEIPVGAPSVWQDSVERMDVQLRSVIGDEFEFAAPLQSDEEEMPIWFNQVATVNGKKVPLSCSGVRLYYRENQLRAVESSLVSLEDKTIVGDPDSISGEAAQAIVSNQLNIAPELLSDASSCIYFDEKNPRQGRVAARVNIDVGEGRKSLQAFVDSETKQILGVEN